jgi:hypothetical protein
MKQLFLTPAAGKRLIARAVMQLPAIQKTLQKGTLVMVAGTTNGYIAAEALAQIGETAPFNFQRFFRGINLPPGYKVTTSGRLADESRFPGDVVIQNGVYLKGQTIDDVAAGLSSDDIILKGANALDLAHRRAAVLVGNPTGGTIIHALGALIGRRVRIIIPIGLEKRVSADLDAIATLVNAPGNQGLRFLPIPGVVFTEIEALATLAGVTSYLIAAGGVSGAEGGVWLAVSGTPEQETNAENAVAAVAHEPIFMV